METQVLICYWLGKTIIILCCCALIAIAIVGICFWVGYAIGRGIARGQKDENLKNS